jgi:hypothetical protein
VKYFIIEFVFLVKGLDVLKINQPQALVDGFFDAIFWHPATPSCIENTESKNETKSET